MKPGRRLDLRARRAGADPRPTATCPSLLEAPSQRRPQLMSGHAGWRPVPLSRSLHAAARAAYRIRPAAPPAACLFGPPAVDSRMGADAAKRAAPAPFPLSPEVLRLPFSKALAAALRAPRSCMRLPRPRRAIHPALPFPVTECGGCVLVPFRMAMIHPLLPFRAMARLRVRVAMRLGLHDSPYHQD
jgi:hypothetical protein